MALIRGLARRSGRTLGSFYVDVTRGILYVLLPLAVIGDLILVSQGAIQNFSPSTVAHTLSGVTQTIAQGPVASQEIDQGPRQQRRRLLQRQLRAPVREPQRVHQRLHDLQPPAHRGGLTFTFGRMVGNIKQGIAVLAAMGVILLGMTGVAIYAEQTGNAALSGTGVTQVASSTQSGGNMEGKSVRFGYRSRRSSWRPRPARAPARSTRHTTASPPSAAWCRCSRSSSERSRPGGIGAGLYGMLMFVILGVFIAGLMVGRTPEYLGKKIEARDVKLAALAILILPALDPRAHRHLRAGDRRARRARSTPGPTASARSSTPSARPPGNNGSAFAGLAGNTLYYNTTLEIGMWLGRYLFVIPILALAGSMVKKKAVPASAGTFPTDTPLFTALLVGVVLIVGALTFFPALALGPILEHFQIAAGDLH